MKHIFENRTFIILFLLALYLYLQLPFLTRLTRVWVDEPWYASTSYNFARGEGLIETAVGSGAGEVLFLYPLLLGTFFKVFGTTLFTGRLFSVLAGLLALLGFIFTY